MIRLPWHKAPLQADKIVVGLGNPGPEYAGTRHNLGFRALDAFLLLNGKKKRYKRRGKARVQVIDIDGIKVLLARPSTYMNLSGTAVAPLLGTSDLGLADLLVVHDEMDLLPGRAKMKVGGSAAGHRGVADIIEQCGEKFARLKIGIGKPPESGDEVAIDYVLGKMSIDEEQAVSSLLPNAAEALRRWVVDGPEKAMTWFNAIDRRNEEDAGEGSAAREKVRSHE